MGIGTANESFSNIKTPRVSKKLTHSNESFARQIAKTQTKVSADFARTYRPRYLVHASLLVGIAALVISNSPNNAHSLSVRLLSANAGYGSSLDATAAANVAADIASKTNLSVASDATKVATKLNAQVALPTTDDLALAKRQVVSTAGNATRDITTYAVQPGDTLSTIASKFNVTTSTLEWANDLGDSDSIKPGTNLTILPISGLYYTVRDGDTAESLATAYSANAAQILSFNNAEVRGLKLGDKIIIPDGVKPQPVRTVAKVATPATTTRGVIATSSAPKLTRFAFSGGTYSYGYCTYYVASRRGVPGYWGNANQWYYNAQASGFSVGSTPVPGAIAWTGAGYYGHVAYVEGASGGMVTISEMNFNGNWNRVTSRTVPASSFRYIY